jgi:hypothetical protein
MVKSIFETLIPAFSHREKEEGFYYLNIEN